MRVGGCKLKFIINKATDYASAGQKHVDIEFVKIATH